MRSLRMKRRTRRSPRMKMSDLAVDYVYSCRSAAESVF